MSTDKTISPLQILTSPTRKLVGIQVYPNCSAKFRALKRLSQNKIKEIIQSKERWIIRKIDFFKQNQPQSIKLKEY